jgi:DNA-directed RNA polymerase beta' subunit
MNLHLAQDAESDAELKNLAAVPYQIISPANNASIVGIYQDSLLGCYRFTRENMRFTPREAMNLLMMFQRINIDELFSNKDGIITNFDILTQIMPPLTLKYKTKLFGDDEKDDSTHKSNNVIEIRNGKYIRGQMEKGVLGAGSKGLLHRVCNDFGNMASADFIDDLQNVITEYLKVSAYSVGVSDLILDNKVDQNIIKIIAEKKNEVKNLIDQVQLGIFENNTGKTNEEEFETKVTNILNQALSETGKIGLKNLSKDNRFAIMVNSGSKGSDLNITFMISCLGQQNVDGKRIPYGFDNRTLPHFTKFDDSPVARGFVESSYINGLSPQELFFHAMGGRVGLIDTAVKSVTWETPIIIIENAQAKYTEIGRWIDLQLDDANNELHVQHFTERQMELLNIKNGCVYIPTTDENGEVTWGEVTAITRHDPGTQLYEIKTYGGRNVIVTESKSLLIWNSETKKLKEMLTPDIRIGDCVPVTMTLCEPPIIVNRIEMYNYLPKNEYVYGTDFNNAVNMMYDAMKNRCHIYSGWWNENNGINFTLPYTKKSSLQRTVIRSNLENIKNGFVYPYNGNRKDTQIPDKFELNEMNGIFIGLFLAEGTAFKNTVCITNNNENIRSFVKSWFDNMSIQYLEKSRINKIGGRTNTIVGNSSILSTFLTKFVGRGAEHKYVPSEAFIAPESFIIGLLNGYFSGDGTVSKNSIDAGSASSRLIEGISMLCSRLGVFGKVFKSQLKSNNIGTKNIKPTYRFSIRAQWGRLFAEKITLLEETKNNKMKNISWSISHRNFNTYNDIVLDKIIEINILGVENHPKMYDLTIPTTLNFGLANGLQVRDTSTTGYIQRRLIKGLEDIMVGYDMTLRTNKGKIVQFTYGDDGVDPVKVENQPIPLVNMSIQDIYAHFNIPDESGKNKILSTIFLKNTMTRLKRQSVEFQTKTQFYTQMMIENRDKIIKNVFKNKGDSVVNVPVAFAHIINNVQGQQNINPNSIVDITPLEAYEMIEFTFANLEKIRCAVPNELFKTLYYFNLSPKEILYVKRFNKAALTILLDTITLNYKRAIVAPGEMVGMIAAQSIGEPTTQMSLTPTQRIKVLKINKNNKNVELSSGCIGKLCDELIEKLPQFTFNTGHANSVETLLDALDEDYYIVGVDEQERTQWNKISHVSRHPVNGQLMKVTTKSGRIVETTTSHSHLIRKDQKVVPIIGADMSIGMRIPVAKHIDNTFIQEFVTIGNKECKLDYLFGWFIGAYLAEGNLVKIPKTEEVTGTICITNISPYFIENTKKFASLFNKECSFDNKPGEYGPGVTTKFSYKPLAQFLLETCDNGSFVKHVPDFAFLAPNEFKAGLIQAYFDGDGNFQCDKLHHQIRVCSRSHQLIKDVALLLNYFDMFGSIKENFTRGSNIYNLAISSKYASHYQEHIGSLVHTDKLQQLVDYVNRPDAHDLSDEIDKINGLGEIIATCGKVLKLPGQSRNYGRWAKKESIGRRTLEKYICLFEEHPDAKNIENELQILKQAANSHVIWDEITNIEIYTPDQAEYVYDFTVPANQTFMTDYGIIVHNTLNTFHFAGVASKSNVTRGVPRIEEILSLSSEPKNPSLTVYLNPGDETDREKAQSIMYMLEHTKLQEIVQSVEICFDPDNLTTLISEDANTMEQYRAFEEMVDECANNVSITDEKEKSKWIIRMVMDAEVMLEKNITMDDINFTLKNSYEDEISCVYSDFNSDKLVFRIRMNNVVNKSMSKKLKVNPLDQSDQIYLLKNFQDQLLNNIIIRGIKDIKKVIVRKIKDNVVESLGTYKKQDIWVLDTIGTNMMDILALDYIDATRTYSNNIIEIYNVFGIEAARQTIYNELVEVIEFDGTYINFHHLSVLCDRMTFTNKLISIFRHGINNDNIGPIAKASFEETPEMFLKAARHAELDMMRGVSANVMCGQEGLYGTNSFQVVLDIDEMRKLEGIAEYENPDVDVVIEKMFGNLENPDDKCSTNQLVIQNNVVNIKASDLGTDNNYNPGF